MSLDGFSEGPNQNLDWFPRDEDFFTYAKEMLRSAGTLLFGRVTYQVMAAYWPSAPQDEIAGHMNSLPKVVVSRTLEKLEWNNSALLIGNIVEEVSRLKQEPGENKDVLILGSARLASFLLQAGLVDEYRVVLAPVLIGRGNLLFGRISHPTRLHLEKTKQLSSGAAVLYYRTSGS
jgi:dihydrofolate reductase